MSRRRRSRRSKAIEAESRIRGWKDGEAAELTEVQDLILTATAYATPGLQDLARATEISVHTLSSWRRGTGVPPPDAVEVLAAVLQERAELLSYYAKRLQKASKSS